MKTKKFRVAQSGPTIDGREITPEQIDQMAASYDPQTYGARIWIEHMRSLLPDSPFRAVGDVVSLSAQDNGDHRMLLAEINPTDDLVKMAKARQKVYWSIEMTPKVPETGGAYLTGLSVTDSPASFGTEMIAFALKSDKAPEGLKDKLFSVDLECDTADMIADDEPAPAKDKTPSIFARVKELLAGKGKSDEARFQAEDASIVAIAEEVGDLRKNMSGFAGTADVAALKQELADLIEKLSATDSKPPRPKTSGVNANLTDC